MLPRKMSSRRSSGQERDGRAPKRREGRPSLSGRIVRRRAGAVPSSRRGQTGAVSIEVAISIGAVVIGFAGLMEIFGATYDSDEMERAAQAAARAVALDRHAPDTDAVACAAVRRELQLDSAFDCATAAWKLKVDKDIKPSELPAELLNSSGDFTTIAPGTGDLVLIRLSWQRDLFSFEDASNSTSLVAMGLARAEP